MKNQPETLEEALQKIEKLKKRNVALEDVLKKLVDADRGSTPRDLEFYRLLLEQAQNVIYDF